MERAGHVHDHYLKLKELPASRTAPWPTGRRSIAPHRPTALSASQLRRSNLELGPLEASHGSAGTDVLVLILRAQLS